MNPVIHLPALTRSDSLRENTHRRSPHIRPPWAVGEPLFREKCSRCDDCVKACPEQIIFRDENGYPAVNFSSSGCTFCAECLETCHSGALQGLRSDIEQAWSHRVRISMRCLAASGMNCQACVDHCEINAIRLPALHQSPALPEINARSCAGCGRCIAICPGEAMSIYKVIERLADIRI
jgi:ferredoxin-type protein NapF